MKILTINYEFPPLGGGGANASYYLSREFAKMGHEVIVLTSAWQSQRGWAIIDGVSVLRVPTVRRSLHKASFEEMACYVASASLRLPSLLKAGVDIVHAYFGLPCGPLSYFAKKMYHVPYVIRMGGTDVPGFNPYRFKLVSGLSKPFLLEVWRKADALVAVSEGLRKLALKTSPTAQISVIPNGVDVEGFNPVIRKGRREPNVLFVGRLDSPRKGVQHLLRAAKILCEKKCSFELTIIGGGSYLHHLRKMAKDLHLSNVHFMGYVSHNHMNKYYQLADVLVLPSAVEGMSNVLLEAMACALPVVATDIPMNREIVVEGETGFLVPFGDEEAFANSLHRLLVDEGLSVELGWNGRGRVERNFTWSLIAKQYVELFRWVLGN